MEGCLFAFKLATILNVVTFRYFYLLLYALLYIVYYCTQIPAGDIGRNNYFSG